MGRIEFRQSPEVIEARQLANIPETEAPRVIIYNQMRQTDRDAFMQSLITLPKKNNLAPWKRKKFFRKPKPQDIYIQAYQRGYIEDDFLDYLKDRYRRTHARGDWNEEEFSEYIHSHNLDFNSRIVELPWIEGRGRYKRLAPPEALHELIHFSDGEQIPEKAKDVLSQVRVGFAGAGVGSSLLEGAVRAGAKKVTVADGGTIMYHDLNRLQGPDVGTVGENHAADAVKKAYEAYPYLDAICHTKNIGLEDSDEFVSVNQLLDEVGEDGILFEEIDNLRMKILIREEARRRKIPVLMATDVGLGTIVDYQPAEFEGDIFPGISREDYEQIKHGHQFSFEQITEFAIQIVGEQYVNYWRDDVNEKKRSFWSQTGVSADASKAHATATLIKWANGDEIPQRQVYLPHAA